MGIDEDKLFTNSCRSDFCLEREILIVVGYSQFRRGVLFFSLYQENGE